jgi:large repetitive protein
MNRWLRTGVFTGVLLCALVVTVLPVYAQGEDAGDAEALVLGVPDTGDTSGATTWWSTDPCVPDRTPPEITLAGDNPQLLFSGALYVEEGFETVVDLCDGDMLGLPAMPDEVTIQFWYNAAMVYSATVLYDDMVAEVEDIFNVLGDADRSADPIVPNPFNLIGGQYTIRYLVADAAGNAAMADRTVEVIDEPTILLQGADALVLECGTEFIDPGALAYEADGTPLAVTDDSAVSFDSGVAGDYVITYTAQPAVGDPITVTRAVTVEDTGVPEIAVPETVLTLECGDELIVPTHVAVDLCDGLIAAVDVTVDASGVDTNVAGTYAILYSVTDGAGNEGTNSRTVVIEDTVPPTIDLLGDTVLNYACDDIYVEAGVDNVFDTCGGALSNILVSASLYGFEKVSDIYVGAFEAWLNDNYIGNGGEYQIVYSVADASGNVSTAQRDLTITCPKSLELRVAEDMDANFATDDSAKGNGTLDAAELDAVFARLTTGEPVLFPNLTRARFDMIVAEIQALDSEGNVTEAAIEEYIGLVTPTLHIELLGEATLDLECDSTATFDDPGAAVFWGDVQVTTVYTTDPVVMGTTGSTVVTYRYTGFDQPEVTVDRTVNVVDTAGPIIGAVVAAADVECGAAWTNPNAFVLDACEGTLLGAAVVGGDVVETSVVGSVFEITYDAEDSLGNPAAQHVLTVTVVDTEAPVVTIDGGNTLQGECGVEIVLPTASAEDACEGALGAAITDAGGLNALAPAAGVYAVVYTATDAEGNEGSETLTVTVEDTVEPVVTIAGGDTLLGECGVELTIPEATAADDCDGAVAAEITGLGGLDDKAPAVGVYTVSYAAADAAGNVGTAELTVTIEDNVAPVVSIDGGNTLTAECGVPVDLPAATAADDCDGAVDAGILDFAGFNAADPAVGEYQIIYATQDAATNQGEAILTVTVEDTAAPVVTIVGGNTLLAECATPLTLPVASGDDVCDGILAAAASDLGGLELANPVVGVYEVVYESTDTALNVGSATLTVTVEDNAGPAVTIDGGDTLLAECAEAIALPTASAYDACEETAYLADVADLGGLDLANPAVGEYSVVYESEMDTQGDVGQAVLTVTVADTTAPVVTIASPAAITEECGQEITLPTASADDACEGTLAAAATDLGGLNLTTPVKGEYTVVYSATDAEGNTGTSTLTVTVGDAVKPVITLLGNNPIDVECGTLYNPQGYSAADVCDGNLTDDIVRTGTIDTSVPGAYIFTYNVSDSAGNAADEATRTVNVVDTIDPVLEISNSLGLTIVDVLGYDVHQVPCNTVWDDLEGPVTIVSDSCATLGWLDVVVTAWPLNPGDFTVSGAAITDKSFTAIPGYYQLDYAVSDGANLVEILAGRYIQVDTQCIEVPDVYDLPEADAVTAIEGAGLVADVQVAYSDLVPIGDVFEQTPAAGSLVGPGTTVTITVARNVVPDLMGMTEAEAAAALAAVDLQQNTAGTTRTLDVTLTGVYDQSVAAGTVLLALDSVAVSVYVPNVIGLTETAAVAAIEAADYTADILYEWSETIAVDIVINQPNAGNGVSVQIVVSLGKQPSGVFIKPPAFMTGGNWLSA